MSQDLIADLERIDLIFRILDLLLNIDDEAVKRWIRGTWPDGVDLFEGKPPALPL